MVPSRLKLIFLSLSLIKTETPKVSETGSMTVVTIIYIVFSSVCVMCLVIRVDARLLCNKYL